MDWVLYHQIGLLILVIGLELDIQEKYANAATRILAEFGIKQLQLKPIQIVAAVKNIPSRAVAERAGAFKEGVSRNRLEIHGLAHDAVIYSFIPQDFS